MSDRRRYPRLAAPLYVTPARKLRAAMQQQVLDASLGGIRIHSDDEKLKVGDPLDLTLFLKDGASVEAMARVAWKQPVTDPQFAGHAKYELGLAFTDVSQATLDLLKSVLIEDEDGPARP